MSREDIKTDIRLLAAFKTAISHVKTELAGRGVSESELSIDALGEDGW